MFFKFILRPICCLFSVLSLQAQMTPSAPVQNFRLPRFADNGYTQWVLQGGKGIYDSAEQIRIEEMALRVYSGDERMALEMTMDSPEATVLIKENRAVSEGPIEIVGANFKVSGVGWAWNGETKEIEVKFDVVVEFTQGMAESLSGGAETEGAERKTEIHSGSLILQTTEEIYRFEFTKSVHVVSGDMDLKSNVLIAIADTPEGQQSGASAVGAGQLDAVRQIIARDQVVIEQSERILRADSAEFLLRDKQANFSGTAQIQAAGAYLSGASIQSREGEVIVTGGGDAGRAQMIVSQAGGLGILGGAALSAETIVLADSITMRELETENRFVFDGSVEVMSDAVQMRSQSLTLLADNSPAQAEKSSESQVLRVGEVRTVVAEGRVRIEQQGQVATSDKVIFYPQQESAELLGNPRVTNGEAIVVGELMQLKPGLAIVQGANDALVEVILPVLPDLGYEDLQRRELPPESVVSDAIERDTVIQARTLHMIEADDHTLFRFAELVSVVGTNLDSRCGRLDVIAREPEGSGNGRLQIERVEAFDAVEIKQTGRVATGNKATILPNAGKVVLEGDAVVTDERGRVSGHRMTLLQGERRAIVEGGGPDGVRAKVTLPQMQPRDL